MEIIKTKASELELKTPDIIQKMQNEISYEDLKEENERMKEILEIKNRVIALYFKIIENYKSIIYVIFPISILLIIIDVILCISIKGF